ncbi:MAG: hypothetical protein IJA65_03535, partial [Acholeplasmatales bacterium]|nr:hypothetical protein [Acholeplasmatales bacterium]
NYDNEYIREYPKDIDVILSYGLFHGDYNARNISTNSFDLYYKDKYIITFDVPFDGRHQILNSLAVIAYLHYLNYDLNILKKGFKLIKLEKNRLEYKRVGNRIILDDSFNSNLIGFKNALNKLSSLNGKRILITPGIVELGKYQVKINKELALYIASSADIVILVGQLEINNLYYNLREYNMELYKTRSFKEAYNLYLKLTKELDQSILLIENDLPDLYKRRLLF